MVYRCPICNRISHDEKKIEECKSSHLKVINMWPYYSYGQKIPEVIYVKLENGTVMIFESVRTFQSVSNQ